VGAIVLMLVALAHQSLRVARLQERENAAARPPEKVAAKLAGKMGAR